MNHHSRGWRVLLSHHEPAELHHCYGLGVTRERIHICARCLGLYPVLLATVGFEAGMWRLDFGYRWLVAFALVTPAVIDWSRSMLFAARGSNRWRTITGALAGIGLGFAFGDYFRDSSCLYFWTLMAVLVVIIALVWWVRPGRAPRP